MKAAVALLALLLSAAPWAQTVYRSVENGVTTFSDTPPADGEAETITFDVPEPADDDVLATRLAQMRETTDRMAADRREREKQRAELRALRTPATETASGAPPANVVAAGARWAPWGVPWFRPRPPFRPHLPGPTYPPIKVPPGWSVMKPGNAQLMRPIVSSRD